MVMETGSLRSHLKLNQGGRHWDCEFCGQRFGFSVPTKTFISHLAGLGEICEKVPPNVRFEAVQTLQKINEGARKRCRTMPGNSVQEEDIESDGSIVGDNCELLKHVLSRETLDYLVCWLEALDNLSTGPFAIYGEKKQLNSGTLTIVHEKVFEEKRHFDYEREQKWTNEDYERRKAWSSADRHLYWMTISRDHNVYEWQNRFAKRIGLDLSQYADERQRAAKLSEAITKKGRCIFFLDNLLKAFDVDQVGIPEGCKLIFTTTTLNVCKEMGCRPEYMIHLQA